MTVVKVLCNLSEIAAEDGDASRALVLVDEGIAISRAAGDDNMLAFGLVSKAKHVWTTLGPQRARRLVHESLALYRNLGFPWGTIQCLQQLAALSLADGATEHAVRLYASASVLGERHGIPHSPDDERTIQQHLSRTRALLGGERFEALWTAQLAVPIGEVIDWALTDAIGQQPQSAVQPAIRPDGLSPRELEILRLIAAGMSNREIAESLYLSPRTVERHIANLYLKIDAHSKAEATAYAQHHHLT